MKGVDNATFISEHIKDTLREMEVRLKHISAVSNPDVEIRLLCMYMFPRPCPYASVHRGLGTRPIDVYTRTGQCFTHTPLFKVGNLSRVIYD